MRPGSGGPFDICSRLKGDEAAFAACRENIETCLEMDEDGEFDEGVESTFVLVDAGGRKFKPNSLHMCQAAAYLIGTTHEGKKNAPAAAGPQVKTIDRKSAPGSFEKNAIVVVGGDAKGAADVAKENPNSRVYFIDASFSDAASRRDAIRDVAFVLSMRMQDAASFVDGGRAALFRMDGGKFVSADPVQVRKQKTSSLPRQASIINIGKDTPPSKYKDGRIFFVGDLGRAKDRKALEDLAKKSSPQNVYLINTNHSGGDSRRKVIRKVASILSVRMRDAAKMVDGKEHVLFTKDGGKFALLKAAKETPAARADEAKKRSDEAKKAAEEKKRFEEAKKASEERKRLEEAKKAERERKAASVKELRSKLRAGAKETEKPAGKKEEVKKDPISVLVEKYGAKKDPDGFIFVDETNFDDHFENDTSDVIVVVGNPFDPEAKEIRRQLSREKDRSGKPMRLVWIPSTGKGHPLYELSLRLSLLTRKAGEPRAWRAKFEDGDWRCERYRPSASEDAKPAVKKEPAGSLRDRRRNMGAAEFETVKIPEISVKPNGERPKISMKPRFVAPSISAMVGEPADDEGMDPKSRKDVESYAIGLFNKRFLTQDVIEKIARLGESKKVDKGAKIKIVIVFDRGSLAPIKGNTKVKIRVIFKNSESRVPGSSDCVDVDPEVAEKMMAFLPEEVKFTVSEAMARKLFETSLIGDARMTRQARLVRVTLPLPTIEYE